MYLLTKNKSDCCGCGVCADICPQNAISMQADEHGFLYPSLNNKLCIKCGLCEKTCIFTSKPQNTSFDIKFFAVCSKDNAVVRQSSSGGMFSLMAEEIFSRGGVVYGAAYGEGFRVEHKRAKDMNDAIAFRTSKYVQSNIDTLYKSVQEDLNEHRTVLFTGTPCQAAGLKGYLKRSSVDTSVLYICDNICHGVSSPLVFSDYLNSLEKYIAENDQITSINMRYKAERGSNTKLTICTQKKGAIAETDSYSYYRLFLNRIANRPSCFACRFTSYNRTGDLSVADFWNGTPSDFNFDTSHGVNEVLINTSKGLELFESIKERAYYQEVTREKAWQPHLEYPTQKPENYDKFWEEYLASADREQVMRKYLKVSPLFKVINFATPILRKTGLYTICGKLYKKVFVKKK